MDSNFCNELRNLKRYLVKLNLRTLGKHHIRKFCLSMHVTSALAHALFRGFEDSAHDKTASTKGVIQAVAAQPNDKISAARPQEFTNATTEGKGTHVSLSPSDLR